MQRHAEGHGHLWQKQQQQQQQSRRTDKQAEAAAAGALRAEASSSASSAATTITTTTATAPPTPSDHEAMTAKPTSSAAGQAVGLAGTSGSTALLTPTLEMPLAGNANVPAAATTAPTTTSICGKPNDWVVIPVFADIVKLALAERESCLQR
ncbi:hypothetical protein KR222_010450 [Zaprionus bogoriensis]|nr:hypothetical protein KR222_010450 [Zaprionus bogoriensis]